MEIETESEITPQYLFAIMASDRIFNRPGWCKCLPKKQSVVSNLNSGAGHRTMVQRDLVIEILLPKSIYIFKLLCRRGSIVR